MTDSQVNRALLFGVFALQMDFITRDAFVAAMRAWVREKAKPLGEVLVEQHSLAAIDHSLLTAIAAEQVARDPGEARKCIAALGPLDSVQRDLGQISDSEVQAGIARLVAMQQLARAEEPTLPPVGEVNGTFVPRKEERFELLRQHAWGGLGEVYVAHDRELNREVALKRLQERHAGSADSRIRFLIEAEITGGLEHPGIVPVYGMGMSDDGRPFYAMRFIRGETLRAAIERFHQSDPASQSQWRIGLRHLLGRFIAVCNAVEYAHSRGVVHRDLKPGNIMLGKYGETLVVDWGLAKAAGFRSDVPRGEEQCLVPATTGVSSETLPGSAIGTPGYMSPEQSKGKIEEIGPASDIYTLGATLYLLLTGKEPFESSNIAELLTRVQSGDFVPPRQCNRSVPAPLEAICLKAMSLLPKDRYPTCAALGKDIEHWLDDEPVAAFAEPLSARLYRWIRTHRILAARTVGLAAGLVAGLIVTTILLSRANVRIAASAFETERQRVEATQQRDIAKEQRVAAERERAEATRQRDSATRQLYVSQMNLAQQAWEDNNVGRVHELLAAHVPAHTGDVDRRGWEWHHLWRISHSELRILNVKSLCLAFSPDGKLLVSGGPDGMLRMWNAAGTREVRSIQAHGERINVLTFSRDGKLLVTGCRDGTAKLWDTATWRELRTVTGHPTWEHGLALSPDATRLAISYLDLSLVDTSTAKLLQVLKGHTYLITSLAFTPDGNRLASGAWDGTVRLWDSHTGRELKKLIAGRQGSTAVAISPDGRTLFSGSLDGLLQSWDLETGKELSNLRLHSNKITRLVFSPDGKRLASTSDDTTVKISHLNPGAKIEILRGHSSPVTDVAFSPGGDVVATAGWDTTIRLWDAASRQEPSPLIGPARGSSSSVAFSPDGSCLAQGGAYGTSVRDASTARVLWTELESLSSYPAGNGNALSFDPQGRILASACDDGVVHLRDARNGQLLRRLPSPVDGRCASVDFSPDGRMLAAGNEGGRIVFWSPLDGRRIHELAAHTKSLTCVAFSHDGKYFASAGAESDGSPGGPSDHVSLWDVSTWREIRRLVGHAGVICSVVFGPDSRQIFTGGRDQTIRVWDVETGAMLRVYRGHADDVQCLSLSPDGKRLASSSDDRTTKIWDVATAQELQTFRPEVGPILGVAFSPDGTRVAVACPDYGRVLVWDARPLTADRRTETNATRLLATLIAQVTTEPELLRRIRERTLIDEAVRQWALQAAGVYWKSRVDPTIAAGLPNWYEKQLLLQKQKEQKLQQKK
jgi:WD40 repeat protein